ncbi:polyprenyl synthetase family protein [Streptomyces sp. NPDC054932]
MPEVFDAITSPEVRAGVAASGYVALLTLIAASVRGFQLAGGPSAGRLMALSAIALPLGEAFQLRDDLLGIWGTQTQTGKPVGDDLRDGKHTALTALALHSAHPDQADQLRRLLAHPGLTDAQADVVRRIIADTGARDSVERMIRDRCVGVENAGGGL